MTEFFNKIKDRFSLKFTFKKANPHAHWQNLLFAFFFASILLILFSFYLLFQIKNQQIFQMTEQKAEISNLVNEKLLQKVRESFDNRALALPSLYQDPSLK